MNTTVGEIFSGNRKFITLTAIFAGLLLLTGILSPFLIQKASADWPRDLSTEVKEIGSEIHSIMQLRQGVLLDKSTALRSELKLLLNNKVPQDKLIEVMNSGEFASVSSALTDKRFRLIAWTNTLAVDPERISSVNFKPGEIFFYRNNLITYLSLYDTLSAGGRTYFLSCSIPLEKHYSAEIRKSDEASLKTELQEKFRTEFDIDYTPSALRTRDGRKSSVEIANNLGNVIGVFTFNKPSLDTRINNIREDTEIIQVLLTIAGFLCLSLYFLSDIRRIRRRSFKLIILFAFLAAFRYLMFLLNFPAGILEGDLTSSSYFASAFGLGIVRSPVELFVSVLMLLFFSVVLYREVISYLRNGNAENIKNYLIYIPAALGGLFLVLALYRGLGASIRSVIFDSSLRYFRDPDLLPGMPAGLMQLNILLLGASVVLAAVAIIILLLKVIPVPNKSRHLLKIFVLSFAAAQAAGFIYDAVQAQPQGTAVIRIVYLSLILILSYKIIIEEYRNVYNYLYFVVIASIISVSLLNYYNTKIERESLKTTALEITRPSESLLSFLLNETLQNSLNNPEIYSALKEKDVNYESASFIIWSRSLLQRERLKSAITILDKQKNILGSFGIELPYEYRVNPAAVTEEVAGLTVYDNYQPDGLKGSLVSGIIPVNEDGVLLGYIAGTVLFNPAEYTLSDYPPFLSGTDNPLNTTVDFSNLKIFDFVDSSVSNIYGEINPSGETIKQIFDTEFNESNEAWINLNINDEDYSTYLLKIMGQNSERIIAVMLKEKNLSWNFYNFLKIFFIHSIFILVLFIILLITDIYRTRRFRFSFRTQLLAAFLVISVLPLIFLAAYNRNLTDSKNQESTLYKLRKRTVNLRNYIDNYSTSIYSDEQQLWQKAASDLDINFTLFSGINKVFSSNDEYYRAGMISAVLNPLIYERLELQSYKEFIISEEINGHIYNSFYTGFESGGNTYILKVSDAFNKIEYPMSGTEVDVLLFGSYSFAVILIIILSAIFANRISYPIRRLTKATESVAGGDLNFEIEARQKSEIGDLIHGFNYMIRQLKKSQAELAEMEREIAWKEMARQVAHEIKNPLTPMKLAVQQLIIAYKDKSPKLDMIFDKVSKTLISQIDTLTNIASEFSSFARMPKLKMEQVNLNGVIEDVQNLFLEERVEISFSKSHDSIIIEADKDQLKRTIINLVRNSIQASASRINITTAVNDSMVRLDLSDNGKGIPPELLDKVFEPDFTTKEKGMGLGLKLAKKFVEAVNGTIKITESSVNGTRILIQFPVLN